MIHRKQGFLLSPKLLRNFVDGVEYAKPENWETREMFKYPPVNSV